MLDAETEAREYLALIVTKATDAEMDALKRCWELEHGMEGAADIRDAIIALASAVCLDGYRHILKERGISIARAKRFKVDVERSRRRMH
jgi:hypothetical protein